MIGMEEVWNKFLLSPLEMARYVDEFASPWVKAYLDVGNMLFYGYPQDWVRTLGKRIHRVHIKDFKLDRGKGQFFWKNIGEGDVDWPEVRKALAEVGYDGWVTTEIEGGDAAYLKDVVARFDRFLAGQKPVVAPRLGRDADGDHSTTGPCRSARGAAAARRPRLAGVRGRRPRARRRPAPRVCARRLHLLLLALQAGRSTRSRR